MSAQSIPFTDKCLRFGLSIVGFPFTITQYIFSLFDLMKYRPEGQVVPIDKCNLHTIVKGQGSYTVILESGMGGCALDWCLVQPEVSKFATVVSYDRAGFGWSIRGREKSTSREYNNDLRALLHKLELNPPYILVGHSLSGMNMRLFAAEYPDEVAGLVLVDSVHEDRYIFNQAESSRKDQYRKAVKLYKLGYLLAPLGFPRIKKRHIGSNKLPVHYQIIVKKLGYRPNAFKAVYLELLNATESARQIQNNKLKHDLPILILSAGKQDEYWKKQQVNLKDLSNETKQIIVEDSWHAIQIHKPEEVISAIREIIEMADSKKSGINIT
jgi:pimeloyl-ACP methyl ester carboxylesterase